MTKTFKIGEYCSGGIITIETKKDSVIILNKEWDYSKGSNRSSDQSNAKVLHEHVVDTKSRDFYRNIENILTEYTTSYYAGEIIDWIKTKVKVVENSYW